MLRKYILPHPRNLRLFQFLTALTLLTCQGAAQSHSDKKGSAGREANLVRVNIITETKGSGDSFVINGKRLPSYQPRIIQVFPATGVVLDEKGDVLTFLGYRWVEIQTRERFCHVDMEHPFIKELFRLLTLRLVKRGSKGQNDD